MPGKSEAPSSCVLGYLTCALHLTALWRCGELQTPEALGCQLSPFSPSLCSPHKHMVVYIFNPSTWGAKTGGPGFEAKFQDSQDYTAKPCLKNQNLQLAHSVCWPGGW